MQVPAPHRLRVSPNAEHGCKTTTFPRRATGNGRAGPTPTKGRAARPSHDEEHAHTDRDPAAQLQRPLNSPPAVHRPHPAVLIGGGGEKKTLRLVAKYADASNLLDSPELPHMLKVLR